MEIDDAPIERALYRVDSRLDALEEEVKALRALTEPVAQRLGHRAALYPELVAALRTVVDEGPCVADSEYNVCKYCFHSWAERSPAGHDTDCWWVHARAILAKCEVE